MSITDKAMLSSVNISIWTARRHDRKASEEVAQNHNAEQSRAGRYNKCLINVKAATYQAIYKVSNEVRKYHEEHTLPWAQDGARILPSTVYFEYAAFIDQKRMEFQTAVRDFLDDYPALKAGAKVELNGLYVEDEYPSVDELRRKFDFDLNIYPVPSASDFRVEIDADEAATIRERITNSVQEAQQKAVKDLWLRLHGVVEHIVDRLSAPKGIFRDSLIENAGELCELLPKLNFTGDEKLQELTAEVAEKLAGLDPQTLRENPKERNAAARRAKEIAAKMAAYV